MHFGTTSDRVGHMRTGHVIFLNGPPSVGKSSTARALQEALGTEHYYLGLDDYRRGYLDRVWLADDGTMFQRMVAPFQHNLATLARPGHDDRSLSRCRRAEPADATPRRKELSRVDSRPS